MNVEKERFFTRHPYIFAVVAIIVFILASFIAVLIMNIAGLDNLTNATNYIDSYLALFISDFTATVLLLAVAWKLDFFDQTFFSKRNLKLGALLSAPLLIIAVLWNILPAVLYNDPSLFRIDVGIIVVALINTIAIGFTEEILFRGLIFRNFLRRYGKTKKGIYLSMIISSLIFGIIHMVNMSSSSPDSIIQQVIYAASMGVIFSIMYLVTGNLLVPILCHGLFDFTDSVIPGFYNIPFSSSMSSDWLVNVGVAIVFIIIAIILIKRFDLENSELIKQLD